MSIIYNSADIAETMNKGVANITGADSTITENYTNVVQHGIKIDMSVSEKTISGTPPLTFNSNGTPLIDYTIYGNTIQDGTPTPDNPIDVNGVGNAVNNNYVIPVTTNATNTINLNSVPTTRKIKKLVLTGTENVQTSVVAKAWIIMDLHVSMLNTTNVLTSFCTHYKSHTNVSMGNLPVGEMCISTQYTDRINFNTTFTTKDEFKAWLSEQYANGTPVTIWYVLATPETSTVNEPLMKIGDYADSASYSQAGVTIPTAIGNNTLDVQTTPKPSNISITYKGR